MNTRAHRDSLRGRWLRVLFLLVVPGCAALSNTAEQETTLSALHACDNFPGVRIARVEPDGRYWVTRTSEDDWRRFQECVTRHRVDASKAQFTTAEPRDLVSRAYFVKVPPPAGSLSSLPPAASEFQVDQPVTFFLNVYKSGRELLVKLKWYGPDGRLVAQQDRVLRDAAGPSTRVWLAQTLPSASVQAVGVWTMELAIEDNVIDRYTFTVVP